MPTIDEVLDAAERLIVEGRTADAGRLVGKVLEFDPAQMRALLLSLRIAMAEAREAEALPTLDRLVALNPGDPGLRSIRATGRRQAGDVHGAVEDLVIALRHAPGAAACWSNLAEIGAHLRCGLAAVALEPDNGVVWTSLFGIAKLYRMHAVAGRSATLSLGLLPDAVTLSNLAVAAEIQDKLAYAHRLGRAAIAMTPDQAVLYANASASAKIDGLLDQALGLAERGLALRPADPYLLSNAGGALLQRGEAERGCALYREALRVRPTEAGWAGNLVFALTYRDDLTLAERDRAIAEVMAPFDGSKRAMPPATPDPGRRLNLVYVSADLRDHPVGRNMVPVFAHHDRGAFAVHVLDVAGRESPLTTRIKSHCESWRSMAGHSTVALADAVRALGADILVVLAGHTGENQAALLAHRAAPVQISYHDIASSALSNADYWVTDPVLHPEGHGERFTEALLRLPCFYLHDAPPKVDPGPVPEGPPRFVSYNALQKLSPATLRLWARVMAAVPEAELVLRYREMLGEPGVKAAMAQRLEAAGIPARRVRLDAQRLGIEDHLASLGGMSVALDPFPFNGSTTTFEALWMGVPVVTLAGESFVGRVAACFLSAIGHRELIAGSEDDYVRLAADLARDGRRLADYRAGLRADLLTSPVLDPAAYTRHLEAGYRAAWQRACLGESPADITVPTALGGEGEGEGE